ncbi:MAG TPA: HAD family hydrolase [Gammaproteobacteria bacterium]|nr:HAD family hydrolase [Gammaproteobacteria bacterium]
MTSIEAILWDFGGVLTTSPFEAFNRFEAAHYLPRDFIRRVNSTNPTTNAWAQFESNAIAAEQFDQLFQRESESLGHPVRGARVLELLSGELRPRMVNVLKKCKEHFKVGCITNNMKSGEGPSMARDEAKAAASHSVMALFDVIVESSIEGVRKPNPRIYEIACNRMDVVADKCVFLDDLGINLKPAKMLGMTTIKVIEEDQAIKDLEKATGIGF